MPPTVPANEVRDRLTLFELVQTERISRDAARWDDLAGCYWPGDARVRVTWFDGSAEEFVARSQAQVTAGRGRGMHGCVPVSARIAGDRALVESLGEIRVRASLHGIEVDIDHWCRFLCRAERRDGDWRLRQFDAVYGKDRVCATRPGERLEVDWALAEPLRDSYRWLAYLNVANGYPYDEMLPGTDRPDLVSGFEDEAATWLRGEPAAT